MNNNDIKKKSYITTPITSNMEKAEKLGNCGCVKISHKKIRMLKT